jgi:hypothetical protein
MNTAAKTAKSSTESEKRRKRKLDSVARSMLPGCTKCQKRLKDPGRLVPFRELPFDVLDKILRYMATSHSPLSVMKLSMVNRAFRQGVNENLHVWYHLYRLWRGPVHPQDRTIKTQRGMIRLRPTIPTSLPNFRVKEPPQT